MLFFRSVDCSGLQYLGASMELSGRTVLEEDLIQELVLFYHPTVILMPGQTVPLTMMKPQEISALKNIIKTTKTFGSLYRR